MRRMMFLFMSILFTGILPAAAQTVTPMPLTETYTTTMGESLSFQYPADWFVLETVESIIIADSEETYTQFRDNPQAAVQSGMVAISILRPQTLILGFSLAEDATLDDLVEVIGAQLEGITPDEIELGEHSAYRFAYPPQRFDVVAFAFESGGLYFATLATASGELPLVEPTVRAIFASFTPIEPEARELPEIEVDRTLVSEPYAPLIAPLTFEYPEGWTISESEFGAVQLSNSTEEGNVFEEPIPGIVRLQISLTDADELPFGIQNADARTVLQFTSAADEAILPLEAPYGEMSEFSVNGYPAARVELIGETSEMMLMVLQVDNWFVTLRAAAFAGEMAEYKPYIMAIAASLTLLPEPEATAEATARP